MVPDARPDAASPLCPPWPERPVEGHGWLYVRALSSDGIPLTADVNLVDLFVRRSNDVPPGTRAYADDPCAVASIEQSVARVRVIAAAIGFSSQEREFSPQRCLETSPCSIELPPRLARAYYEVAPNRVRVRKASDLPAAEREGFAVAVAEDALARSRALSHPLADELDKAARETHVPAKDLAIRYAESKLRKRCDAGCLEDPALEPELRTYLKATRRSAPDPFQLRTPPERWRQP